MKGILKKGLPIVLAICISFSSMSLFTACTTDHSGDNDEYVDTFPDPDTVPGEDDKPVIDPDEPGEDDKPVIDPDEPGKDDEEEKNLIFVDNQYKISEIHDAVVDDIAIYVAGNELFSYIDAENHFNYVTIENTGIAGNEKKFVTNKVNVDLDAEMTFEDLDDAIAESNNLVTSTSMFEFRNEDVGEYYNNNKEFFDALVKAAKIEENGYIFKTFNEREENGQIGVTIYGVYGSDGEIIIKESRVVGDKDDLESFKLVDSNSETIKTKNYQENNEYVDDYPADEYVYGLTDEEIANEANKIYMRVPNADGSDWEKDENGEYITKFNLQGVHDTIVEVVSDKILYDRCKELGSYYDEENNVFRLILLMDETDRRSLFTSDVPIEFNENDTLENLATYLSSLRPKDISRTGRDFDNYNQDDYYAQNKEFWDALINIGAENGLFEKDQILMSFKDETEDIGAGWDMGDSFGIEMKVLVKQGNDINLITYKVASSSVLGNGWKNNILNYDKDKELQDVKVISNSSEKIAETGENFLKVNEETKVNTQTKNVEKKEEKEFSM